MLKEGLETALLLKVFLGYAPAFRLSFGRSSPANWGEKHFYMPHATSCPRTACHRTQSLAPVPSGALTASRSTPERTSSLIHIQVRQTLLTVLPLCGGKGSTKRFSAPLRSGSSHQRFFIEDAYGGERTSPIRLSRISARFRLPMYLSA